MNEVVQLKCEKCGVEFAARNPDVKICLACRVSEDMKLPPDTIVNASLVNIWQAKRYDVVKGIDPIYLMVAEGVYIVKDRIRPERQLCSKITYMGSKNNKEIDKFARRLKYRKDIKSKYDVLVFFRISPQSDFKIFGISYSDRMMKKLANKTVMFRKQYSISLAVKWFMRKSNNIK